jgi:hypothetical protein
MVLKQRDKWAFLGDGHFSVTLTWRRQNDLLGVQVVVIVPLPVL